jgi:hypothetical protein
MAVQVGLGIAGVLVTDLLLLVTVFAIAAAILLVALRVVMHQALLEEGGALSIGPPSACPNCHHLVPTMLFCPVCGVARSATPKARRAVMAEAAQT